MLAADNRTHGSLTAHNSPNASRRGSLASIASAQTDPGLTDRSRTSSAASAATTTSTKSGFRSLFSSKKDKPAKAKKDTEKIVLTSRHAAAVKTKMMMDAHKSQNKSGTVKTAEVVGTLRTGHLSAAQQEARHPHSGPPAIHIVSDMPSLTRIVSGDERDEEDEFDRLERARAEWEHAKLTDFTEIREQDSRPVSPEDSRGEHDGSLHAPSDNPRASVTARNIYGGRFHRNNSGQWTR